ncbi:MAG: amidohydrolase family protein [Planctomycetaceae bacterium]|nr:amidohydrolase family protein [Planctomycetaceae bacterium]
MRTHLCALFLGLVCCSSYDFLSAGDSSTRHVEGLHRHLPEVFALTEVRIVHEPGRVTESGTVVVRDGKITAAGADVEIPKDAEVLALSGKTIFPGLIDSYGEVSLSGSNTRPPTAYWNEQIRGEFSVRSDLKRDQLAAPEFRKLGFVARLIASQNGILRGQSAVYSLGTEELAQLLLRDEVALTGELTIPRRNGDRDQYPNSPMGAVALARQAMYDAIWYRDAHRAVEVDPSLRLPEKNATLAALVKSLDGGRPVMLEAANELFAMRADDYAREFGLDLIIVGSGNEYRRLAEIAKSQRPIVVPVNFPKAPNVATPESARSVSLESLMHWDLAPENLAKLHEAGVEVLLTCHRLGDRSQFLKNLRIAVKRGFPADAALAALTTVPAKRFQLAEQLGSVSPGKLASFLVTDGDLFAKKTKIVETWVAGERFEHEDDDAVKVQGDWKLTLRGVPRNAKKILLLNITGEDKLKAKVRPHETLPKFEKAVELKTISREGSRLSGQFLADEFGVKGVAVFSVVLEEEASEWLGTLTWPDGTNSPFVMTSNEDQSSKEKDAEKAGDDSQADENSEEQKDDSEDEKDKEFQQRTQASSFAVNSPLGAFGRDALPEAPKAVAFVGGTIWTSGPEGTIKGGTVLVEDGKIVAVGKQVDIPEGTLQIDVTGKHVSPGLIDCHSHIASDGGINESAQAITAEVRIGDFIDCDDIDIYWQLAGGLTTSNILHGSANPIGGQNQVIKMRWGGNFDDLKFEAAPQGIKFALGENVKQSNWGDDHTTRYPQTRMGVEQIMRDELLEAQEYAARREAWAKNRRGLPVRRDLELDAMAEVLAGDRWIHCHSYRQDEILALIRTLDEFGITIGSFQHILEGYKVADAMAKHGATGSSFSDWWAYKVEVQDAIPFNGAIMFRQGIAVSFNSDDGELGRRMNQEAAKAMKYGKVPAEEALKFVTLNPAIQLRIDQYVGSLEPGKHADLAIWSGSPLSNLSRCEQTWIDGRKYFDASEEQQQRKQFAEMRNTLIQKILDTRAEMLKDGEENVDESSLWPRHDEFCHTHDGHGHGH